MEVVSASIVAAVIWTDDPEATTVPCR